MFCKKLMVWIIVNSVGLYKGKELSCCRNHEIWIPWKVPGKQYLP